MTRSIGLAIILIVLGHIGGVRGRNIGGTDILLTMSFGEVWVGQA